MSLKHCLVCVVLSFSVGCDDPSEPRPVDTAALPSNTPSTGLPAPHATLAPGQSVTLQARDSLLIKLQLPAGSLVDLGVFAMQSNLAALSAAIDSRFASPALEMPEQLGRQTIDFLGQVHSALMLPALAPSSGGDFHVLVRGQPRCTPGGPVRTCTPQGTLVIELRPSAPVVEFKTKQGFLSYLVREGTSELDTLFVRNAGAGTLSLDLAAPSPFDVSPQRISTTGPTRTIPAGSSAALRIPSSLVPGSYLDTLILSGVPDDRFNTFLSRRSAVRLQVYEAAATSASVTQLLASVAISPSGEVFAANYLGTLFRFDPVTGQLDSPQTLPGPLVGGSRDLKFGADGALYMRLQTNQTLTFWKRAPSGELVSVFAPMPFGDYAVLPDGSVYVLVSGDASRLVRLAAPFTEAATVASFGGELNVGGVVFSPSDSTLYYTVANVVHRRALRTGDDQAIGNFSGARPFTADASSHIYLAALLADRVTVIDRDGAVLQTRWPPARTTIPVALGGGRLVGLDGFSVWTLPVP